MKPPRKFILSFALLILIGAILLWLPLSDDYVISEVAPPNYFLGKSLAELQLRSRYHVEVIAIKDVLSDKLTMVPKADVILKDGDVLIVVGKEEEIRKIR